MADYYKETANSKKRRHWLKEIVAANENGEATERTQFLAAKATLELAEPAFQNYRGIHLVQPLKVNLKKKKTAMKEVIDAYTKQGGQFRGGGSHHGVHVSYRRSLQ